MQLPSPITADDDEFMTLEHALCKEAEIAIDEKRFSDVIPILCVIKQALDYRLSLDLRASETTFKLVGEKLIKACAFSTFSDGFFDFFNKNHPTNLLQEALQKAARELRQPETITFRIDDALKLCDIGHQSIQEHLNRDPSPERASRHTDTTIYNGVKRHTAGILLQAYENDMIDEQQLLAGLEKYDCVPSDKCNFFEGVYGTYAQIEHNPKIDNKAFFYLSQIHGMKQAILIFRTSCKLGNDREFSPDEAQMRTLAISYFETVTPAQADELSGQARQQLKALFTFATQQGFALYTNPYAQRIAREQAVILLASNNENETAKKVMGDNPDAVMQEVFNYGSAMAILDLVKDLNVEYYPGSKSDPMALSDTLPQSEPSRKQGINGTFDLFEQQIATVQSVLESMTVASLRESLSSKFWEIRNKKGYNYNLRGDNFKDPGDTSRAP